LEARIIRKAGASIRQRKMTVSASESIRLNAAA
jgi:hypothetical protein